MNLFEKSKGKISRGVFQSCSRAVLQSCKLLVNQKS